VGVAPCGAEFIEPQFTPFQNVAQSSWRKRATNYAAFDFHSYLERAVPRMEVRRRVVIIIHIDRNAEEPTDDGHAENVSVVHRAYVTSPLPPSSFHCD
jgi:hypothetical protein